MLLFATIILSYLQIVIGYIEMVNEQGWQDREFRLTCRQLSAHIAVLEARFIAVSNVSQSDERIPHKNYNITYETYPVRLAMNQRCSGRNYCSFILHADCPGSKLWGPGQISFKYACITEENVVRFCNLEVIVPEGGGTAAQGFIMSPGYPKFYIGQSKCRWRIRAPKNQRVELTLLDISLSGVYSGSVNDECEDYLSVLNEDFVLMTTCQKHDEPPILISDSNILDIILVGRTGSLVPKRGILMYYRAVECPTVAAPLDGYLVHRNGSTAEYMCCVGFVFPDTLERTRTLRCLHNRWDQQMPSECIYLKNFSQTGIWKSIKSNEMEDSYVIDIIIPSVLIAGLLIGNAVIVFIIYQYRQRNIKDFQEEELNTMVSENVP